MTDSPSYPTVQACNAVGVEHAEDRRWMKHPRKTWRVRCHGKWLSLARYRFEYSSGHVVAYSVAQCPRCGTVHWCE